MNTTTIETIHGGPIPADGTRDADSWGGFAHPGPAKGCDLCAADGHWHNCFRLGHLRGDERARLAAVA